MTDKELFDKLKREGECWHEWEAGDYWDTCKNCKMKYRGWGLPTNPDFSTWSGFGWLLKGCEGKGISVTLFFISDTYARVHFANTRKSVIQGLHFKSLDEFPKEFIDALKQFLKEEGNGD